MTDDSCKRPTFQRVYDAGSHEIEMSLRKYLLTFMVRYLPTLKYSATSKGVFLAHNITSLKVQIDQNMSKLNF